MTNEKVKIIRDTAIAIGVTMALLFLAGYVPLLAVVCFVCGGVPFAVIASKYELKVIVPAFLITAIGFLPLSGHWVNVITTMVIVVIPGIVAGYMGGRKWSFYSVLITVCTVICIGWILEFTVMEKVFGISIEQVISNATAEAGKNIANILEKAAEAGTEYENVDIVARSTEFIRQIGIMIIVYIPAFIVVLSMIMGYIMFRVSGFVIRKTKMAELDIVPFCMMKVPRSMCWIAIIAYLVYNFSTPMETLWTVLANAVFVLYTIMVFGGLSCVDYWLSKKINVPCLRVLIYVGVVFVLPFASSLITDVLIIIAILDSGRNFRNIGIEQE